MLVSVSSTLTLAEDWQKDLVEATKAAKAGDDKLAFSLYLAEAEKGNALAQFTAAWYIKSGAGGQSSNKALACEWFERSAKAFIPVGLQETGHCYREGILKSDKPVELAMFNYQAAIENGVTAAACDLLKLQLEETGKYDGINFQACQQVSAQGALYGQEILIELYADPKLLNNNEQALYWLNIAAPKSGKSAYRLAISLLKTKGDGSNAEIDKDTLYWFEQSATLGYLPAYLETAALYYQSIKEDTTQEQASSYLAKAYVWAKAWTLRKQTTLETPQWVSNIINETPETWYSSLDAKINEHIKLYKS